MMGPLSSLFDLLTFGGLLMESMATQILVIFIILTTGRPWKDLPQPALIVSSLIALVVALVVPFTPAGRGLDLKRGRLACLAPSAS
jgi:Mg2+-importing ATPase